MPKGKIDYSKSFIYKLCCKDVNVKKIYVGSTTGWKNRKNGHKYYCNNIKSKSYNIYVYKFIRDNGGWDNWDMVLIEQYNATDFKDLCKKERYWLDKLGAELNTIRPYISVEEKKEQIREKIKKYYNKNKEQKFKYQREYRNKNKEKMKEYRNKNKEQKLKYQREYRNKNKEQIKEYYNNNKEQILERNKEYKNKNKERIKDYQKEYRNNNKERIKDYKKEYNNKNKERIKEYYNNNKEKITCECGCDVIKNYYKNHLKTKKHIKLVNNNV